MTNEEFDKVLVEFRTLSNETISKFDEATGRAFTVIKKLLEAKANGKLSSQQEQQLDAFVQAFQALLAGHSE